ncbi:TetR/AcrR family transcriptional regulator [Pseudaestuariivita rosea]|uniref:TetR/AcrR family transcriptional regulator n=1 Tax=Pseudaestuariivita rosea TaxID=2763263 RepID=UPI001F44A63B|nr:TetR/AcrR family transcriptional regulator [Pseudaestuariivita rosea]
MLKKRSYHHGDLRAQLVEATRQLVEEKGPDHFSVSEACRVAGVSTAAPYRHFKDKEEMLLAVIRDGKERMFAGMVAGAEAQPEGSINRIFALGRGYIDFALSESGIFRLMFGLPKDSENHQIMMDEGPVHYVRVEQEVALYLGRADIDDDVRKRAFMLWTFVHGLSFLLIDGKVSVSDASLDIDDLLMDIGRRVMADIHHTHTPD